MPSVPNIAWNGVVGEQQLQYHYGNDADRQVLVSRVCFQRERRVEQVTAVQKVEDLADHEGVKCDCPASESDAPWDFIQKNTNSV